MEIWKDIKGFEGQYQVSDTGKVKSLARTANRRCGTTRTVPERILATIIQSRGYVVVTLSKNDKDKRCRVHQLVATHFIENPFNYTEINHKDGNKLNNNAENLEWCTRSHNLSHAYRNGLKPSPIGRRKQ